MKVRMIPLTTYYFYYTWKWKTKCGNQKKKKKEEKVSLSAFQFPGGAFVNCENFQLLKMAFGLRILVSILVVFLLLQTLNATSTSSGRRPLAWNKNHQIPPNCTHLVFKSQCSQNLQCRWCKSQSLDDTYFTRFEAWRLPLLLLGLFLFSFSFWVLNFLTFLGFYFYFSFFLFFSFS